MYLRRIMSLCCCLHCTMIVLWKGMIKNHKWFSTTMLAKGKWITGTLNKIATTYTCRRKSKRWLLTLFFHIIDISGIATFVIWLHSLPDVPNKQIIRKKSLGSLVGSWRKILFKDVSSILKLCKKVHSNHSKLITSLQSWQTISIFLKSIYFVFFKNFWIIYSN